jgi:hypothetical protein
LDWQSQSKWIEIDATGGDDQKIEMAQLIEYFEERVNCKQNASVKSK